MTKYVKSCGCLRALGHLFIRIFFKSNGADDPVLLDQVVESLPALPSCELVDPADDQTLPRLIEALEKRQRVRQLMSEQLNKTGRQPSLISGRCLLFIHVALGRCKGNATAL